MNLAALFFTLAGSTLVLLSGERIPVDGPIEEKNGRVTFRSRGLLYSLPVAEIDETATAAAPKKEKAPPADGIVRLRVGEEERKRLLKKLEQNRAGQPPQRQPILEHAPTPPTSDEVAATKREESEWRRQARAHEESIRRAKEDLQLIESEIEALDREIRTLLSLGYSPRSFTHETTRLERLRERIPRARLEIERAQRAWDQFREDARREGVMPGWLR